MSGLSRKGTQDSLSSVAESEVDRNIGSDGDGGSIPAAVQPVDEVAVDRQNQRKKSDPPSTSSHELPSPLQIQTSSAGDSTRSHSPNQTPDHSPKAGHRSPEMRVNSQSNLSSVSNLANTPCSQSPVLSSVNSFPSSREASIEKSVDGMETVDLPIAGTPGGVSNDGSWLLDNISRSSESGKSIDWIPQKSPESAPKHESSKSDKISKAGGEKKEKKKTSSWYNMLNPTYKSRSFDFKRLFKDLPEMERLIVDYSCALQKDILVHGRLYVSQNYVCFYANIFRWETFVIIKCRDVTSMTKEKTARVIPNAIQICTESEKHFFTSFGARDKTFLMLFRIWQNALLEQPMSSQELWQWVHYSYGEELGLTSGDDDDYVPPPSAEDDNKNNNQMSERSLIPKENGHILEKMEVPLESENDENIKQEFGSDCISTLCEAFELKDGTGDGEQHPSPTIEESIQPVGRQKSSECPTDLSDTTESEVNEMAKEIHCPCAIHEGKEFLNTVIPLTVDQVFQLIFTGSKFYHDLLLSRKTYDIMESAWQLCPELGHKMRQVTYTLTLNHSMAKSAQTTETQRLSKQSKSGQLYVIDCDVVNTGIPYSDTFSVKSYYCITRVSSRECRLRVHGCVRYKKSVWGLVKSLIEKSAVQGVSDFCTDLEMALLKESEQINHQSTNKKTRRRKRVKVDSAKGDGLNETPRILHRQASARKLASALPCLDVGLLGSVPDLIVRVILLTLVVLLLLNVLLFYKLWSLEDQSVRPSALPQEWVDLPIDSSQSPMTHQDFVRLLRHQDALHRAETERWRDALSEVIKLIRLIENSLSDLKSSIDSYGSASVFKSITLATSQTADVPQQSGQTVPKNPTMTPRVELE